MSTSMLVDYTAAMNRGNHNDDQNNPARLPLGFYWMTTSQGKIPCHYCDRCKLQSIGTERVVHCNTVSVMPTGFKRLLSRLQTVKGKVRA